jgi:hypothetical protein
VSTGHRVHRLSSEVPPLGSARPSLAGRTDIVVVVTTHRPAVSDAPRHHTALRTKHSTTCVRRPAAHPVSGCGLSALGRSALRSTLQPSARESLVPAGTSRIPNHVYVLYLPWSRPEGHLTVVDYCHLTSCHPSLLVDFSPQLFTLAQFSFVSHSNPFLPASYRILYGLNILVIKYGLFTGVVVIISRHTRVTFRLCAAILCRDVPHSMRGIFRAPHQDTHGVNYFKTPPICNFSLVLSSCVSWYVYKREDEMTISSTFPLFCENWDKPG